MKYILKKLIRDENISDLGGETVLIGGEMGSRVEFSEKKRHTAPLSKKRKNVSLCELQFRGKQGT